MYTWGVVNPSYGDSLYKLRVFGFETNNKVDVKK